MDPAGFILILVILVQQIRCVWLVVVALVVEQTLIVLVVHSSNLTSCRLSFPLQIIYALIIDAYYQKTVYFLSVKEHFVLR